MWDLLFGNLPSTLTWLELVCKKNGQIFSAKLVQAYPQTLAAAITVSIDLGDWT